MGKDTVFLQQVKTEFKTWEHVDEILKSLSGFMLAA